MRAHERLVVRAGALALASLVTLACTAEAPRTGVTEQKAVNPPLPASLNLALNTKTTLTIGPSTGVNADVASSGVNGSVMFDVSANQGFSSQRHVLANTVEVRVNASVGTIIGNNITVDGSASQRLLGLDPASLPAVPSVTPATPGTTNVTVAANQSRQICPGQYGVISLGIGATLNLNGGVYHITRINLAEGARLQPSEPVVLLVAGNVVTGTNSFLTPSPQALNPMTARDIRIEVGGAVTLGDGTDVRAHLLVPTGKLQTGRSTSFIGAGWARSIVIGAQSTVTAEGVFSLQTPSVPEPCNDNNACTADQCVSSGTLAFCRNTVVPSGTSCEDGNSCNGEELCNATGQCQAGTNLFAGTPCPDGTVCNGDETCNGRGACTPGTPLAVNDRNACTTDSCDPEAGVLNDPVPDGTACGATGSCEAGVCSVQGTVFSEDFVQFQSAPAQCTRWNQFLDELTQDSYSSVTMTGTFDLVGVTCSNPAVATQICRALNQRRFTSVTCDGRRWEVEPFCGGTELVVDRFSCSCGTARSVRPCTGTTWGGVNTETCEGPSQNMTVICE